jgi:hypothetical protein
VIEGARKPAAAPLDIGKDAVATLGAQSIRALFEKRPKHHHLIPEMHLKHFTDANGMVWTYHKASGNLSQAVPRETCVQRNFYAIERELGQYQDDLEGWLGLVESHATPIYEKLLLGKIPQGEDRGKFAWFIATMYARTPGMVRMFAEIMGSPWGTVAAMMTASRKEFEKFIDRTDEELGPLDLQTRDQMFEILKDPTKYKINVDRSSGLGALGISEGMANIFYRMGWSLLKPEDCSTFFVTSDHPVTRIVPQKSHLFYGDGGFMNPKVLVTLPLSPDRLLIMTWGQDTRSGPIPILSRMVRSQNKQRAIFAEAQIYADRKDAGIQTLTKKYKDQRDGLKISGFGADRQVKVSRKLKP